MNQTHSGIMVFIEINYGAVNEVSYELLTKAAELSELTKEKVIAVLLQSEKDECIIENLISYGADQVININHPLLKTYMNTYYAKAFTSAAVKFKPSIILIGATSIGRDIAPRIAVHINTGLTADCTGLEIDNESGGLFMTRPAFGGNIMATIACPEHRPQMSTVRPGVFEKGLPNKERSGEVIEYILELEADTRIEVMEEVSAVKQGKSIEKSEVLISCGRGIGGAENIIQYEELAERLNGCLSGSRAAVNLGYIDKNNQVGQTGKTVRPALYIACGISGAIQHIVGMENSDYIIAINKDEKAPIFETSHLGIVGDANEIVKELLIRLEQEV